MKRLLSLACTLCLLVLTACNSPTPPQSDTLTITTTTYPVYLLARAVVAGIPDVTVERLDTGSVSCLHDYTLSVSDMKKIERADVLAISGAGLEAFMSDALAACSSPVIDCSEGVELLPATGHHDHEHSSEDHSHFDPHYWMDPLRAQIMVDNLCLGLAEVLPEHGEALSSNAQAAAHSLNTAYDSGCSALRVLAQEGFTVPGLITFHDGFQYFAQALDLPLLRAIEEEAGSEASAKEIVEISRMVKELDIPVIFTEVNGSAATANAIARETGCRVVELSMLMDGREPMSPESDPANTYAELFLQNVCELINGFAGQEVLHLP